jgi:hypothetical protein
MNAIDKLRNLQAGELDKVLEGTPYFGRSMQAELAVDYDALENAAEVEVTKVVVDEVINYLESVRHDLWEIGSSEIEGSPLWETRQALTLLQQLKESLYR